ncbi:hypothetical protein J3L16_08520 [Alteromonas sp. 5E99-2]|uniref:hypothetical protein n=1 Tax=Alteromonas sp. 5E99-2 TaxID=2817683 RepID=UPI001A981D0B|nr:hypothetical protein [Alteromonas sp. 5E99-2]MBO1255726.1 hypothetical protein [Alteromonas sp. 5E99-2]
MKFKYGIAPALLALIVGCSSKSPCEDVLEVKRQELECKRLQAASNSKNLQQAGVAKSRFKAECENLRYYRDDYDTICKGEQKPIGEPQTAPAVKQD